MGNLQVRFLEGWAPAMAPGHSTLGITVGTLTGKTRAECSRYPVTAETSLLHSSSGFWSFLDGWSAGSWPTAKIGEISPSSESPRSNGTPAHEAGGPLVQVQLNLA